MSKGLIAKKEDSPLKHLLIAVIVGVVLSAVLVGGFVLSTKNVVDTPKKAVAFFDEDKKAYADKLEPNCVIGQMTFGDTTLDVVYKSDYSNLVDSVSLVKGAIPAQVGIGYYEAFGNKVKGIKDQQIVIKSQEGKMNNYSFRYSFSAKNKNDLFLEKIDYSQGLVIFYQIAGEHGFSSQYEALVFEEVK